MIQIGGGGGAATPAGSDTQVQFNDGGAFGADTGLVFDKATGKLTVGKQLVISSGSLTASTPVLDLAQTWNSGGTTFTGLKFNVTDTASASGSLLMDLQVGGASKFKVNKTGTINASAFYVEATNRAGVAYQVGQDGLELFGGGTSIGCTNNQGIIFAQGKGLGWVAGLLGSSSTDLVLLRDAADILAQRRSTNAQTFRVYNTFTDASNYERASLGWVGNVFTIQAENAGTGSNRGVSVIGKSSVVLSSTLAGVEFKTSGSTRWAVDASGNFSSIVDNALDIGAASANRPRSVYAGTRILATGSTAVIGYGTGAGGAVTQTISRTTGVTLDKAAGAITLVSAAGSATWQSFTVTNSTVAATDTVVVNQKSGTDLYMIHVTNVAAGSFQITFATTGGTTTEQPVFNYAVVKSVAA